ncbi:MAG: hypothetical protein MHMPM18_001094 [Marteilia pararefringens]
MIFFILQNKDVQSHEEFLTIDSGSEIEIISAQSMERRNYILTGQFPTRRIPLRFQRRFRGGNLLPSQYNYVPIESDQAYQAPMMATYLPNSAQAFAQAMGTNGFIPINDYHNGLSSDIPSGNLHFR